MNMSGKLLSIIIPAYNMEDYLPKCVGSLVVNDPRLFGKLDIIIVNDGSQDRTSEVAHGWADRYPDVIKVIDKANGHYGSCINAGLKVAMGEYVRVLDSDDWFNTVGFEKYLRILAALPEKVDLILNDFELHYEKTGRNEKKLLRLKTGRCSFEDIINAGVELALPSITYRMQILRDIDYRQTEKMLYTDIDWDTLPMRNVQTVYVSEEVVYQYRIGRDGQSVSIQGKNVDMMKALVLRSCDWFLRSSCCSKAYIEHVRRTFITHASCTVRVLMFECPYSIVNDGLTVVDSTIKAAGVVSDKKFDDLCLLSCMSHPYRYFRAWQKNRHMSHAKIWVIRRCAEVIRSLSGMIRKIKCN